MDCVRCGETLKAVQGAESTLKEAMDTAKRVEKENKEVQRKNTELRRRLSELKARVMALEAKASFTGLVRDGAKAVAKAGKSAYNAGVGVGKKVSGATASVANAGTKAAKGLYAAVSKRFGRKGNKQEQTNEDEVFSI